MLHPRVRCPEAGHEHCLAGAIALKTFPGFQFIKFAASNHGTKIRFYVLRCNSSRPGLFVSRPLPHALVRVIAPWPDLRSERNSIMKLMMSLFGLIVLLGSSGCVIHERGGVYDDGYYRGDGYGYRYDHDHDRWGHDNYYRTYRY